MPIEGMTSGLALRLRQAWQAASTMSSKVSKTVFESQFSRTDIARRLRPGSGAPEGNQIGAMLGGMTRLGNEQREEHFEVRTGGCA